MHGSEEIGKDSAHGRACAHAPASAPDRAQAASPDSVPDELCCERIGIDEGLDDRVTELARSECVMTRSAKKLLLIGARTKEVPRERETVRSG